MITTKKAVAELLRFPRYFREDVEWTSEMQEALDLALESMKKYNTNKQLVEEIRELVEEQDLKYKQGFLDGKVEGKAETAREYMGKMHKKAIGAEIC